MRNYQDYALIAIYEQMRPFIVLLVIKTIEIVISPNSISSNKKNDFQGKNCQCRGGGIRNKLSQQNTESVNIERQNKNKSQCFNTMVCLYNNNVNNNNNNTYTYASNDFNIKYLLIISIPYFYLPIEYMYLHIGNTIFCFILQVISDICLF